MLKLYYIDFGPYGCSLAIASSREEAIKFFADNSDQFKYENPDMIEEHEIKEGLVINCKGDR